MDFMEGKTLDRLYALRDAMAQDVRFVELSRLSKDIEENPEVIMLSKAFKQAEEAYNERINRYGENSPLSKESLKELSLRKSELDTHPLVLRYNEAFIKVRDITILMDDILFGSVGLKADCGGCSK